MIEIEGAEFTLIIIVLLVMQPNPLSPSTVYVVVVVGETTVVVPVNAPGFHVYDVAPLPVKVAEEPAQIVLEEALAVTVAFGLTTNVIVWVPIQVPLSPSTV